MTVKTYRILKLITALATVLLLAALAIKCLSIYVSGMNGAGPIYTAEAVVSALLPLVPFFIVYILLVCAAVFVGAKAGDGAKLPGLYAEKSPSIRRNSSLLQEQTQSEKKCRKRMERSLAVLRFIIFGAAILLIIFGVLNGGAEDVFIKAINICTECIGLG